MTNDSFQQRDLLEHPKIKLFITQGGHQSMEEAIHCKVPVLVIPFLGDQVISDSDFPFDLIVKTEN
jgi:glucuronosyltransferase